MIEAFIHFVRDFGLPGFLLVVLFLLIQDPERAVKLKALFFKPLYDLFKWGSKQYIASEIAYTTTEFLDRHVIRLVPSIPKTKIRIKWVTSPTDPVLSQDGTLILRLTETNDQTRNILAATRVALPQVVCPTLRPNVQKYATSAIDLALLRNLADKLGKHAKPVFQRYFFSPEIQENQRAAQLFQQLVLLDEAGIFVSIFLEELNVLGESIFASGDSSDKTDAVLGLANYLLRLAKREIGERIDLEYLSQDFKLAILLLAISWKAQLEGLPPYVRRVVQAIKLGCDSIYIVAYPNARDFLRRILAALESEARLNLAKRVSVRSISPAQITKAGISELALFRRNTLYDHSTFQETVADLALVEGAITEASVVDVSIDAALLQVGALYGVLPRRETSWYTVADCRDALAPGQVCTCLLKTIDRQRDQIHLSLRLPETDPWRQAMIPKKGDSLDVRVDSVHGGSLICRSPDGLEIAVPLGELSWFSDLQADPATLVRTTLRAVVYEVSEERHLIEASVRRLTPDPWPEIHHSLPKGTELRAVVLDVTPERVRVSLPNGLAGVIPNGAMVRAGYELADFQKSVVPGQGLDVVVTKVFIGTRKIRLDLRRNVEREVKRARLTTR